MGQGRAFDIVPAQEIVQFLESLIVHGYSGIQQFISVAELDPGNGFYAFLVAFLYKINHTHAVVDVGERHCLNTMIHRQLYQFIQWQRAVAKTEV